MNPQFVVYMKTGYYEKSRYSLLKHMRNNWSETGDCTTFERTGNLPQKKNVSFGNISLKTQDFLQNIEKPGASPEYPDLSHSKKK